MAKLGVFNFVTLNGYFQGPNGDIGWHSHDAGSDEHGLAVEGVQSGSALLFGRVTYELMANFWPTPLALQSDPVVAEGMNRADKIVFSRTLKKADWSNTRIASGDLVDEVTRLKQGSGKDMTILGSGSIVTQLAQAGLIDDYQFMVDPVALGDGTPIFRGMQRRLDLRLTATRTFKKGHVLLCYQPAS